MPAASRQYGVAPPPVLTVTLPIEDVRYLLKLMRRERHRAVKEYQRSTFVPEPGRLDAKKWKIDRLTELIDHLDAYV